jgi:hypothetical protein
MVREEATRAPDPGGDHRARQRKVIADWFERNAARLHIQETEEGAEYRKAMEAWRLVPGAPLALKPAWKGRGERSILEVLDGVERMAERGEAVFAIVDDRKARAAIRALEGVDIDLMATETFLFWLATRFEVKAASTAWEAIKLAAGGSAPDAPEEDPVHVVTDG